MARGGLQGRYLPAAAALFLWGWAAGAQVPASDVVPDARIVLQAGTDLPGNDLSMIRQIGQEACVHRSRACFLKAQPGEPVSFVSAQSGIRVGTDGAVLARAGEKLSDAPWISAEDRRQMAEQAGRLATLYPGESGSDAAALRALAAAATDAETRIRWLGATVAASDTPEDWVALATATDQAAGQPGSDRDDHRRRSAALAALNGWLRDPGSGIEMLRLWARLAEEEGRGRDALQAIRLAAGADPADRDLAAEREGYEERHGFRVTGSRADPDGTQPRVCASFSEPLTRGIDLRPFVQLPDPALDVEVEGHDLPQARAAAKAERDRVIDRALSLRIIDAEAAETARATPLPEYRRSFPAHAALLADRLRRENPGASRIETTIDARLQVAAERLAARAVARQADQVSAAILLADHGSGEILAQVGTAQFADGASGGFVDMTRALRSPGSTLKPFVYALGFDEGLIHSETLIEDRPAAFGRWQPQNFDSRFRGTVTIRQALVESLNLPVVRVAEALGPARIMVSFRRAGMELSVQGDVPGLAVVLGGAGVSLADMVQGYATLARGGQSLRLHDRPGIPREPGPSAFGPVAAWQTANVLAGIMPPGGRAAGRVAYKTGTSYGHRDALAIGFDGRFVAGVWMGRPDGTPVMGAFGGDYAAPVLFDLFDALGARSVPLPPPPKAALTVPNAALPRPLRRFAPPGELLSPSPAVRAPEPLTIQFPPDSSKVELLGPTLVVRAKGGTPPYSWLLNGVPVVVGAARPTAELSAPFGFSSLTVVDAKGRSARVEFRSSGGG
ncbi:penicillin-binding transpeptidase domain-containing protein [Paracoccus benzoatiresistens]|uniref:Penicillin-binding transpeptidase domain-containing protein n=1 Tax=Paracoccus benzoatiresistens TaxID=2997341 RepID=A0ABT4JA95_9RHOB|nr:penicillin-binding transpeptidase domain-containing protein [Paracoccus sp. EF6]MCZ0963522.1 penicillin-binding transpeptidase domain-containing protein [Paracoccus sp. EF6]